MAPFVRFTTGSVLVAALAASVAPSRADDAAWNDLQRHYTADIRPLVTRYCGDCHGPELAEAEINLVAQAAFDQVRKHPDVWQKVAEMLASGQMPPPEARQPADEERAKLLSWVQRYLKAEARERAGDPGPVVLRRLSNAEYTYALRDLTGVASLSPAHEFPADGAAGEGFTNAGSGLVMSPALLEKYLGAAKEVADHAVLLPSGLGFSPSTTRRDWTEETLAEIRQLYARYSDAQGGTQVNLQGIVFDTNGGGRLPLEKYFAALLAEREQLDRGTRQIADVARDHRLSPKYLAGLWTLLSSKSTGENSPLIDSLRSRWATARPGDAALLAAQIAPWQQALWKFNSVGHIGKLGGPKSWMEEVQPLAGRLDVRLKLAPDSGSREVTVYLTATDAGDGADHDFVVWERPRLVAPGRPDLLLRDVRGVTGQLVRAREKLFAGAAACLTAAAESRQSDGKVDVPQLAEKHGVAAETLAAWLGYLGIGASPGVRIEGHFANRVEKISGYDFIRGWSSQDLPLLAANSSDQHVRIPGNMQPHSVAVHPTPTLAAAAGWQSPIAGDVKISGLVQHAHPECGNGVAWSLELRRGATRQRLAAGIAHGGKEVPVGPIDKVAVQPGDLVSLVIGPRDANHSCDLTRIDLSLATSGDKPQAWSLAGDVSGDLHVGNPHADRLGNDGVWHFYSEPVTGAGGSVIPAGSLLARWQSATDAAEQQRLADEVQRLLLGGPPAADTPDAALYEQLASLGGPLLSAARAEAAGSPRVTKATDETSGTDWGPDPALFGRHPTEPSAVVAAASLCVQAPATIAIRLPADLVAGYELVIGGTLHQPTGADGSVQLEVTTTVPPPKSLRPGVPFIAAEGTAARRRLEASIAEFRRWFPAALCYAKIVPVDEVVTLTLFHREDGELSRLMLSDAEAARLDRLWDELHYISQDSLTLVDAFAQLMEYATQDADPKVFEPLREPIHQQAAAYRQRLAETEPQHLTAVIDLAARAYRRALTRAEGRQLRELYQSLRKQELPHEEAIRLTLARVLVAPAFLYRTERSQPGQRPTPVSDDELATRLSFFLWSSLPDDELRAAAAGGKLHEPHILAAQTRRMLKDDRVRRLATEFACQWLQIYEFDQHDEKSPAAFPGFAEVRGPMYEEAIQVFVDLVQRDGSILELVKADHTFVNEALARHYGIDGLAGPGWRRVEGVGKQGRGGILALGATLSKQSGASRTSPILRGNWVCEVLLGEKLPKPPPDVPVLADAVPAGLTERQLIEKHSSDQSCARCHARIDPYGFALEGFDAIGRLRTAPPVDVRTQLPDGTQIDGLDGLRTYLLTKRRDDFLRQFCRKLLGYALGRAVQLSDEPLLDQMQTRLAAGGYRLGLAIEDIVASPQFRMIRGRDYNDHLPPEDSP